MDAEEEGEVSEVKVHSFRFKTWVCPRPEQRPCSSCPAYEACLADAYRFIEKVSRELPR